MRWKATWLLPVLLLVVFCGSAWSRTNPAMHWEQGMDAFSRGDYKGAIMDLKAVAWYHIEEKIKKGWPLEPIDYERGSMGYLYRGACYAKLKQMGAAIRDFQNAEKWGAGLPEVQMNIATEYYRIERYDDAIRVYGKVLEQDPKNGLAHYFIGFPYLKKKNYEQARLHAQKAQELGVKLTGLANLLKETTAQRAK